MTTVQRSKCIKRVWWSQCCSSKHGGCIYIFIYLELRRIKLLLKLNSLSGRGGAGAGGTSVKPTESQKKHTLQQLWLCGVFSFFFPSHSWLTLRSVRVLPDSPLRPLGVADCFVCWALSWFIEVQEEKSRRRNILSMLCSAGAAGNFVALFAFHFPQTLCQLSDASRNHGTKYSELKRMHTHRYRWYNLASKNANFACNCWRSFAGQRQGREYLHLCPIYVLAVQNSQFELVLDPFWGRKNKNKTERKN